MTGILVFSERLELVKQLTGKARELADRQSETVSTIALNEDWDLISSGADKVYLAKAPEEFSLEPYRALMIEAIKVIEPSLIMIGATKRGKELAPRIAASLRIGCISDCISLNLENGKIVAERLTYGGSTIAKETCASEPAIITITPRAFEIPESTQREGKILKLQAELPDARVKVIERRKKSGAETDLENATIIVSAGRGFKEKKDLKLLEELAKVLGANMGCTRPISADLGWMNEWVGISGKKVKPQLYIACGISGTIQHMAGIRDSNIIVSINNDENATINSQSDYVLVGDLYEVLPSLIKALKIA